MLKNLNPDDQKVNKMNWQPIDTAPKETSILIYMEDFYAVAYYDKGWITNKGKDYTIRPTHWMPLPPPPEKA